MDRNEIAEIRLTRHAREQMVARDVTPEEVGEAILRADVVEPSRGARRFVKGDLVVVVAPDARRRGRYVVVTVLLRSAEDWTDEDVRRRRR